MSAISKVVYGNQTLIDLTADTITANDLAYGVTAHGADGEAIVGASTKDSDTSDATALAGEILSGKTAYARGAKITGTMTNRGSVSGTISTVSEQFTIQSGYHDGSGKVSIDSTEQAKIIASNIKSGVEILGVTGSYTGEGVPTQSKTATPYTTQQTILPDAGYNLSQVVVNAIKYVESANSAGGITATIGDVAPT